MISTSNRPPVTILLIDDDVSMRRMMDQVLRTAGYRVLVASDGREAKEHWDRDYGFIDVILADIVMPGLSGPELVRGFRSTRPDLKVMFISGTDDPSALESAKIPGATIFLAKPFNHRGLLAAVSNALAS